MLRVGSIRLGVVACALALIAAGCGGGDDEVSSSKGSTTTSTPSNNPSNDASIEQLQRELNALGCNAGPIDGELGPDTLAGIKQFQAAARIAVDGIVGPQTRAALEQAATAGSPNCRNTPAPPTTTTTTASGNQPNCNAQPINAAVVAGLLPNERVTMSGPFECAGIWATVAPTVTSGGGPSITITVLLRWNGSAWQSVDRAVYCENGSVPPAIFQKACESN